MEAMTRAKRAIGLCVAAGLALLAGCSTPSTGGPTRSPAVALRGTLLGSGNSFFGDVSAFRLPRLQSRRFRSPLGNDFYQGVQSYLGARWVDHDHALAFLRVGTGINQSQLAELSM